MKSLSLTICWLALSPSLAASAADNIDWHHWELEAFAQAKENNKIILVSVGMEGCAACARMEALTYPDNNVIEFDEYAGQEPETRLNPVEDFAPYGDHP